MDLTTLTADQLLESLVQLGEALAKETDIEARLSIRRKVAQIKGILINRMG